MPWERRTVSGLLPGVAGRSRGVSVPVTGFSEGLIPLGERADTRIAGGLFARRGRPCLGDLWNPDSTQSDPCVSLRDHDGEMNVEGDA